MVQIHALLVHAPVVQESLQTSLLLHPLLEDTVGVEAQIQLQTVADLSGAVVRSLLVQVETKIDIPVAQSVPQRPKGVDGPLEVAVIRVIFEQHRRIVEIQSSSAVIESRLQLSDFSKLSGEERILHKYTNTRIFFSVKNKLKVTFKNPT